MSSTALARVEKTDARLRRPASTDFQLRDNETTYVANGCTAERVKPRQTAPFRHALQIIPLPWCGKNTAGHGWLSIQARVQEILNSCHLLLPQLQASIMGARFLTANRVFTKI